MKWLTALLLGGLAVIGGYFALGLTYESLEDEAKAAIPEPWGLRYQCGELTSPRDSTPVLKRNFVCTSYPSKRNGSGIEDLDEQQIISLLGEHIPNGDQTTIHYWPEDQTLPKYYEAPAQISWLKQTAVSVAGPIGSARMGTRVSTRPVPVAITLGGIFLAGAGIGFFAYRRIQCAVKGRQSRELTLDTEPVPVDI